MTIGALYFSREFLVPVAVAGLLTFVLSPIVRAFERVLPRPAAVVLVVVLAFAVLGGFAWALAIQAADLGKEIPTYSGRGTATWLNCSSLKGHKNSVTMGAVSARPTEAVIYEVARTRS